MGQRLYRKRLKMSKLPVPARGGRQAAGLSGGHRPPLQKCYPSQHATLKGGCVTFPTYGRSSIGTTFLPTGSPTY